MRCSCGYAIGHPLVPSCTCKKWVGLTDKEIAHIEDMTLDKGDAIRLTAVALMEKNT